MINVNDIKKVSRSIIGAVFKMHPSNVNRWLDRGCPKNPDGKSYNLAEVVRWRLDELSLDQQPVESEASQKWLMRFRRERTRIAKIERKKLEGGLAPWEEIESEWRERVVIVTSGLEAFKNRLPGILVGKSRRDIQDILEDEIKNLRMAYATEGKYCPVESKNKDAIYTENGTDKPEKAKKKKAKDEKVSEG